KRLRVDRIDLYQLHTPDPAVPYDESIGALVELRDEGKIGHIGLSNIGRRQLATAQSLTPIASVQNRFNHRDRTSEKVLDVCETEGIAFLPWGPIQTGDDPIIDAIATEVGSTVPQVALAWLLRRSPVMLPIPGTSSIQHLEGNMKAATVGLSAE